MSDELMDIVVKCTAFTEGDPIPVKYTAGGANVSPPLTWSGVPHETRSLVVMCDDPDAPRGTWSHWVLFGLSPETRELAEGASPPSGAVEGTTSFGTPGYGGPSPPPGPPHRYYFKVSALSIELKLSAEARRDDVLAAMNNHVLAEGWLMGTYGREAK